VALGLRGLVVGILVVLPLVVILLQLVLVVGEQRGEPLALALAAEGEPMLAPSIPLRRVLVIAALASLARTAAADPEEVSDLSSLPRVVETASREPPGPFPPPPPEGTPRTFSAALSIGPGWLALHDGQGRDGQGATSLVGRLAKVFAPEWCAFLGVDRSSTERGGARFAQTAALLGVQRFLFGRLYLGGALAMAMVKESGVPDGLTDGPGYGFSAAVGVEALRGRHAALTAELSLTVAEYPKETWEMGGVRLGMVVF
jgi:hypothetical protein